MLRGRSQSGVQQVEVGGIDVGRQAAARIHATGPGTAEVHLAGEKGADSRSKPQSVGEGRNVGGELGRIVIDPRSADGKSPT